MGFFDDAKDKVKGLIDGHEDKVEAGIEKAGDLVDDKTGGKFEDKVDMAQEKATDAVENSPGTTAPRDLTKTRGHDRFVVVPASYVFLLRDGTDSTTGGTEVLLQRRQNTGYMDDHWAAAAAGHLERGETAEAAAHREAAEEIGVTDLDLAFVTSMQRTRHGSDRRARRLLLRRPGHGPRARIVEPASAADLRWCPLAALPDPVVPHELAVLQAVRSGDAPPYTTFGFDSRLNTGVGDGHD